MASLTRAAWDDDDDDDGCYISQLCLERCTRMPYKHGHTCIYLLCTVPNHSHTRTHTHISAAHQWMCWMQNDCSTGVSRAPCWHGNSSLNKTNHRHGTMLIKTKAHSVADGTSHQIVFTHFHKATIIPPHQQWLMAIIAKTPLSPLFPSPLRC